MKKGFTLVELLVVIGMLMILIGSVTTSVAAARKRAKISQAQVGIQEMTNAILAYENYLKSGASMPSFPSWQDATEGNLSFLLGKGEQGDAGAIPVLYNAAIRGGKVLDPWGRPYQLKIVESTVSVDDPVLKSAPALSVAFPNFNRR